MKKTFIIIFLVSFSLTGFSQTKKPSANTYPSIQSLIQLLKTPLKDLEIATADRGYVFESLNVLDTNGGKEKKVIRYVHKNNNSFSVHIHKEFVYNVSFLTVDNSQYIRMKKLIAANGFVHTETETTSDELISNYKKGSYQLEFCSTRTESGKPIYMVSVSDREVIRLLKLYK